MTPSLARVDTSTWLLLAATILVLAAGQVLFKFAANGLQLDQPRSFISVSLLVALAVYGIATVMWLVVLSRVPLSIAFPFYGFTFVLVPVLAAIFLKEPLRMQTLVGGFVILVGVAICARGAA